MLPSYRELADTTRSLDDAGLRAHPLVGDMRPRVIGAMQNTRVVKVKIYDRDGRTIFSTDISQIGKNYATNAGFQAALRGSPLSELTHRDRFSAFDREIVDRDVLSSYVALRAAPGGAPAPPTNGRRLRRAATPSAAASRPSSGAAG